MGFCKAKWGVIIFCKAKMGVIIWGATGYGVIRGADYLYSPATIKAFLYKEAEKRRLCSNRFSNKENV